MRIIHVFLIMCFLGLHAAFGQTLDVSQSSSVGTAPFNAFDYNRRLGQAINLGNTLEAPNEGDWGFKLQEWHFEKIAEGGFDSVRVPIKWSGHADEAAPYTIDTEFFERIDWVIEQSQRNHLAVVLDVHHYDEISVSVDEHRDRLAGLWTQIASRYKDEPTTSVFFEIMNEPHGAFSDSSWRRTYEQSLAAIRETNPDRQVIVGGIDWNSNRGLSRLRLPDDDPNLIGTFHYYNPFPFTHQGAEWVDNSDVWIGTTWENSDAQQAAVRQDFNTVDRWSDRQQRPVFMGEFGAYRFADTESREKWTHFVSQEAEARGYAWGYWEFGAGFGVIDRSTREWIPPIYDALEVTSLMNLDDKPGLDLGDIDLLSSNIAAGSTDGRFDLDGDGTVALRDLQYWLYFSENLAGDTNLDGRVEFEDFLILVDAFGTSATWSRGDFDADGTVGFSDFLLQTNNFSSQPARSAQVVPEPNPVSFWLIFLAFSIPFMHRRARLH